MMHILVRVLSLVSVLFFTGSLMAFDIQTNVLVQGEINGKLKSRQMSLPVVGANSELSTYSFVIKGREGLTLLDHVFIHDPTVSKLNVLNSSNAGYALRVSETAGFAAAYSDINKSGAVKSSYLANQIDLSTDVDLEKGLYAVNAMGEGSFSVVLIEDVDTIDPEVFEKYSYQLEGSGEFDLTGQYSFIGGSPIKVFPLENEMFK